jgi:hypothetical protein
VPAWPQQQQVATISGKLELIDGMIGLEAGGVSHYTPRLRQLVGFVRDLQEGATVTLVALDAAAWAGDAGGAARAGNVQPRIDTGPSGR